MKTVFVTGANGLLGTNLILTLLDQGYDVKALVRNKRRFIHINHSNLQIIEGNLSDWHILNTEIAHCNYVVHIAANTNQNLLSLDDYYPANIAGTQNIISACEQNKIEKLVYIGTANTFGYGSLSDLGDETKPMKYPYTQSLYAQSKKQAQDIVDAASTKVNITTISPTFIIGPHDSKPSSGRIIRSVLNKKIAFYPSGGKNFIHVKDVVRSIILSFRNTSSGNQYIVANENMSYHEFLSKVITTNRQNTVLIKLPDVVLGLIGLLGNMARFLKVKTDISSVNTKILTVKNYYSNHKAKTELMMNFTPIEEAIDEALHYFNSDNPFLISSNKNKNRKSC